MYIDAHSRLRRTVLKAALERFAEDQFKNIARIAQETGDVNSRLIATCDEQRREAMDVLDEMDYYERRRATHPAQAEEMRSDK